MNLMKRTIFSLSVAAMFGSGIAHAVYTPIVSTTGNNFTMVGATNGLTGGNNTTAFTWDGTYRTAVVTDGSYNATISSVSKFAGYNWIAHNVNIYAPGIYNFETDCAAGNPSVGCVNKNPINGQNPANLTYTLTVGTGQVGVHMLFDWGAPKTTGCGRAVCDTDIVVLWDMNKSWAQTSTSSPLQTGAFTTIDTLWNGVSIDTNIDADNYSGTQMIDVPFVGQSINFSVNGIHAMPAPVPVPTAAWLFFSGLLGLIGVARGKAV